MSRKTVLHVCWVLATLAVIGAVTVWMTVGGDREVLRRSRKSSAARSSLVDQHMWMFVANRALRPFASMSKYNRPPWPEFAGPQ